MSASSPVARRRLCHEFAALQGRPTANSHAKTKVYERSNSLWRRADAWHEAGQALLPSVALARSQKAHAVRLVPFHLRPLFFPSTICSDWPVPEECLQHEWRLREARAYDTLDDLRGQLEVLAYVRAVHVGAEAESLDEFEVITQAEITLAADRYRSSYQALVRLANALGKTSWKGYFLELHDHDLRYITEFDPARPGDMPWFWCAGGTSFLKLEDLQDVSQNRNLHQGEYSLLPVLWLSVSFICSQPCVPRGAGHARELWTAQRNTTSFTMICNG